MTKPTLNDFKKLVKTYIEHQFPFVEQFALERFGVKDPIELKVSFSDSRKRSCGGYSVAKKKMYISILGNRFVRHAYEDWKFDCVAQDHVLHEYPGFEASPKIGKFSGYWTTCVMGILCHEVAHAIQLNRTHGSGATIDDGYEGAKIYATNGKTHAKHGLDFQYIYQILREQFVNPYLNDPEMYIPPKLESVV